MKLKTILNEVMGKRLAPTQFPEFYGEMDDSKNDIANAFVTHIERELDGGITTGTLKSIDYLTSDENDPYFQETDKWYYDLVRYMMDKGNEVIITSSDFDKVWNPPLKLTLDPKFQDVTWQTLN